jgi:hypothetical protein
LNVVDPAPCKTDGVTAKERLHSLVDEVVVVTANLVHLSQFVPARRWQEFEPG